MMTRQEIVGILTEQFGYASISTDYKLNEIFSAKDRIVVIVHEDYDPRDRDDWKVALAYVKESHDEWLNCHAVCYWCPSKDSFTLHFSDAHAEHPYSRASAFVSNQAGATTGVLRNDVRFRMYEPTQELTDTFIALLQSAGLYIETRIGFRHGLYAVPESETDQPCLLSAQCRFDSDSDAVAYLSAFLGCSLINKLDGTYRFVIDCHALRDAVEQIRDLRNEKQYE